MDPIAAKKLVAFEFKQGKVLSEDSLAAARAMAMELPKLVADCEALSLRDLIKMEEPLFAASDTLEMCFVFNCPSEAPSDPVERVKWEADRFNNRNSLRDTELAAQWQCLLDSLGDTWPRLMKLVGRVARWKMAEDLIGDANAESAHGRWAKLDPVKDWAFQQRKEDPPPRSRAAVIRRILPEIKIRAKAAGEPLTGDDPAVTRTVTRWFSKAGIR